MKLESSRKIFHNYSNTKFHKNSSIGSKGVPYGQTDRQVLTKLIVAFRNFAKAPKRGGGEFELTRSDTRISKQNSQTN